MSERIVFLDFDGVLNSRLCLVEHPSTPGVVGLDQNAVVRLNRLAARANFVVCSAWRHGRSVAELQAILNGYGFRGHVCGKTPRAGGFRPGRGMEIKMWLDFAPLFNHEVESFVILDDDSDMDPVADRHIQTSFDDGLQDAHVDLALKMLYEPR